jgi:hypothetical protein
VDVYGEPGGAVPGTKTAVTTDRERETEAETLEPLPGNQLLILWYVPETDRRRDDPYLITPLEYRGDHSPHILVGGRQDRQRFPGPVPVLPRDFFEVLLGYPDLAKAVGQPELPDQRRHACGRLSAERS